MRDSSTASTAERRDPVRSPVTSADIQGIEMGEDEAVSAIRYCGAGSAVTIRAQRREDGGRRLILHAEPVG